MNKIWFNRLIAGTHKWANMPSSRRADVSAMLKAAVEAKTTTAERYEEITGEPYVADDK